MAPGAGIPRDVQAFVAEHLGSVAQLEALLLLRGEPDRAWALEDAAAALVTRPAPARLLLDHLLAAGLVELTGEGRYRYAPPAELETTLAALERTYATRRSALVQLIFSGAEPDGATSIADAFRIRRPSRDG